MGEDEYELVWECEQGLVGGPKTVTEFRRMVTGDEAEALAKWIKEAGVTHVYVYPRKPECDPCAAMTEGTGWE